MSEMYFVIGASGPHLRRTNCESEEIAVKHAARLLDKSEGGGLKSQDKLLIVKVVKVVERTPPPVDVRDPEPEDFT